LTNLYPTTEASKMERFRKKWYKKNIDPAFDVNYEPPTPKEDKKDKCGHGMSEQERFRKQFEENYKKQDPVGAYVAQQTNLPDEVPSLASLHNFLCIAFLFAYPVGFKYTYIIFAANLVGWVRKGGWPKWTAIYLRNACFTEEFTNLTYFLSIALTPASFFTYTPVLINVTLFVAI